MFKVLFSLVQSVCMVPVHAASVDGLLVLEDGIDFLAAGTTVPIPASAWLFGSAIGLLGWMRRKECPDAGNEGDWIR